MSVRRHHGESGLSYWARSATNGGGVNSLISNQLSLELKLQENCRELLDSYKQSQDWYAVGQLAQTLITSSSRISDLKRRLQTQEHLPYLEKISESVKSQLQVEAFPGSTVQESLEDSPVNPEKAGGSLFKAANDSQDCVNKQELSSLGDLPGGGLCASVQELPVSQPAEDLRCSAGDSASSSSEENLNCVEEVGSTITSAHLNHTDLLEKSQTEGEKSEDIVFRVEDMDDLEDQMEKLADQFTDLSEECGDGGKAAESETKVPVAITIVADSDLEVPEYPKATYASSDSSDQFFTPRNSLCINEGETSSGEADQYEDARSGIEDALPDLVREIPLTFSIRKVSEGLEGSSDLYLVKASEGSPFRTHGFPSDVVVRNYSEFTLLEEQLVSSGHGSMLVKEPSGGYAVADLEAFLNRAAGDPRVRELDCFVRFLGSASEGDSHLKLFQHCGMFITVNLVCVAASVSLGSCSCLWIGFWHMAFLAAFSAWVCFIVLGLEDIS